MPPTIDQASLGGTGTNTPGGGADTLALTTTATVAAGAHIFVVSKCDGSRTMTCAGGSLTWATDSQAANGTDITVGLMRAYALNGLASGATLTVTYSALSAFRIVSAFSVLGLSAVGQPETVAATKTGSGTALTTNALTVAGDGRFVLAAAGLWVNSSATATGPFAETLDYGNAAADSTVYAMWDEANAGSISAAGTWATSSSWVGLLASYAPDTGAPGRTAHDWSRHPNLRLRRAA